MSHETWHKGHREVRNVLHNEIGVTKEEIQEIFRTIAKDEISKIMGEEREFIRNNIRVILKEVIKGEMLSVLDYDKFPKVIGHTWNYYQDKGDDFKNFILNTMKTEIIDELRDTFDINLEFNIKKNKEPKFPEGYVFVEFITPSTGRQYKLGEESILNITRLAHLAFIGVIENNEYVIHTGYEKNVPHTLDQLQEVSRLANEHFRAEKIKWVERERAKKSFNFTPPQSGDNMM